MKKMAWICPLVVVVIMCILVVSGVTGLTRTITKEMVTGKVIAIEQPYQGGVGSAWTWAILENGRRIPLAPNTNLLLGGVYTFNITTTHSQFLDNGQCVTSFSLQSN